MLINQFYQSICRQQKSPSARKELKTINVTSPDLQSLLHNDRAMIRQNCNVEPGNVATIRSNELLARLDIDDLNVILREKRLRWF